MSTHWEKSLIPYFAVLQDTSTIQQSAFQQPKSRRPSLAASPARTPLSNEQPHFSSATPLKPVLSIPTCTYPEIEYVFQDDPSYETLESGINNDEEAIIVELDKQGEHVKRYCSLTTHIQVLNVRIKDRNMTKTIEVDVTRSVMEGVDDLEDTGEVENILQLGELFTLRNKQLKAIMDQQ